MARLTPASLHSPGQKSYFSALHFEGAIICATARQANACTFNKISGEVMQYDAVMTLQTA
jgi:hypothetical protein